MKTNAFRIQTPEGIVFTQSLASPVSRFLGWSIDLACILTVMSVVGTLISLVGMISKDVAGALTVLSYFVVGIGYGILLEWYWRGQTIGKRVLRLRVVDAQGLKLQFSQVAIRNLLRFIDCLPLLYLVGGIACLASRRSRRLGDIVANTVVVRVPKIAEPDLGQLLPDKYNSLRGYSHLVARVRQRATPAEASLALQAIIRRDEFEPAARVELFRDIAAHFQPKVEFPADATDGITDEQYVRNLADILFRSSNASGSRAVEAGPPLVGARGIEGSPVR